MSGRKSFHPLFILLLLQCLAFVLNVALIYHQLASVEPVSVAARAEVDVKPFRQATSRLLHEIYLSSWAEYADRARLGRYLLEVDISLGLKRGIVANRPNCFPVEPNPKAFRTLKYEQPGSVMAPGLVLIHMISAFGTHGQGDQPFRIRRSHRVIRFSKGR